MICEKKFHMKYYRRAIGGGGIFCPCCFPTKGKDRKLLIRSLKRSMRQMLDRELKKELDNT